MGLFSAVVSASILLSIQDLRLNPQDTTNFHLANIDKILSDPNQSDISSPLPSSPPPFIWPNYAIWVNSFWFLSLVINIICTLLTLLLQQWAQRYLKVTQTCYPEDILLPLFCAQHGEDSQGRCSEVIIKYQCLCVDVDVGQF